MNIKPYNKQKWKTFFFFFLGWPTSYPYTSFVVWKVYEQISFDISFVMLREFPLILLYFRVCPSISLIFHLKALLQIHCRVFPVNQVAVHAGDREHYFPHTYESIHEGFTAPKIRVAFDQFVICGPIYANAFIEM